MENPRDRHAGALLGDLIHGFDARYLFDLRAIRKSVARFLSTEGTVNVRPRAIAGSAPEPVLHIRV
jgi:hypothetical protein